MANINNVNIDKIKILAKEQGLKMKYFADCFGKRATFLSEVRAGKDKLDQNELSFIANKLNTTIEYLTDQTDKKEKPVSGERQALENEYVSKIQKLSLEELKDFDYIYDLVVQGETDLEALKLLVRALHSNRDKQEKF